MSTDVSGDGTDGLRDRSVGPLDGTGAPSRPAPGAQAGWPGLLLAPLVAFAHLAIGYALVPWSCQRQNVSVEHAFTALCLVVTLATVAIGWRGWRAAGVARPDDAGDAATRSAFLALVGLLTGALMSLVIVAEWIVLWMQSPCAR